MRIDRLARTATDMFLEQGYASLTVDQLIARAGGSRRNVYDHFGGKDGLLIEAVKRLCVEIAAPMEALPLPDGDPVAGLRSFAHRILEIVLHPRAVAMHRLMVAEGERFPELAQAIYRAGQERAYKVLTAYLHRHRRMLGLHDTGPSPEILAEQFVDLIAPHAQLRALIGLESTAEDRTEIVENALKLFLRGIGQLERHTDV